MSAKFEGFADGKMSFFKKLSKNQNRDWFAEHKSEFEEGWHKPMVALLTAARDKLDDAFPHADLGEPKVFRIHRDVRFSKDKSPYKTHVGGVLMAGSRKGQLHETPAALYLQLGTECFAGAGHYSMLPDALGKYRKAVADEKSGKELVSILSKLEKAGFERGAMGALKKAPKGFDPSHPRVELLKMQGLIVSFPAVPTELVATPKILDWAVAHAKKAAPLVEWLIYATA